MHGKNYANPVGEVGEVGEGRASTERGRRDPTVPRPPKLNQGLHALTITLSSTQIIAHFSNLAHLTPPLLYIDPPGIKFGTMRKVSIYFAQ